MTESTQLLLAIILGAVCVAVFGYEVLRQGQTEITIEKLAALGLACFWLAGLLIRAYFSPSPPRDLAICLGLGILLPVPLALIWFGDELGELTGFNSNVVQGKSPEFLLRTLGWCFLLLVLGWITIVAIPT